MKVTQLSSAMTRKLFQSFYPIGTWGLSLIIYYAYDTRYGENWTVYSWVRLAGFGFVFLGTYFYMEPPKLQKQDILEYNKSVAYIPVKFPVNSAAANSQFYTHVNTGAITPRSLGPAGIDQPVSSPLLPATKSKEKSRDKPLLAGDRDGVET